MEENNLDEIIQNNMLAPASAVNKDLLRTVEPVELGHIYDGHGATGLLVHIGFLGKEPVYRTTHGGPP